MMKRSALIGAGICLYIVSALGHEVEPAADEDICISRFEAEELLTDIDKKVENTSLKSLNAGKFFIEWLPSGDCVPTYETYLIGRYSNRKLKILSVLQGHSPHVRLHELQNEQVLLLFYHTGANTYVLESYRFTNIYGSTRFELIEGTPIGSNMKSIEVTGDIVIAKSFVDLDPPAPMKRALLTETYRYQNDAFVLISENREIFEYSEQKRDWIKSGPS